MTPSRKASALAAAALTAATLLFAQTGRAPLPTGSVPPAADNAASRPDAKPFPLDPLAQGFVAPPDSAKPRTWWHWAKGNVTDTGITKDLEWMKRVGIGGAQISAVNSGSGQEVQKKIYFGTPEWYASVQHAVELGRQLGLEMSIFSSPGWSEAGGPWVKPSEAMKKLVWSTTHVDGPKNFDARLPEPPSNEGPVLNASARPNGLHFYRDSTVIAFRTPEDETPMASLHPTATSSGGPIDDAALLDDNLNTAVTIASPAGGGPAWLQYEFAQPYTARALSLGVHGVIPVGKILASDDGVNFRTIEDTPGPQGYHGAQIRTFAFPAVTARFFRIEFDRRGLSPAEVITGENDRAPVRGRFASGPPSYSITQAIFYSDARVNRWEDKGTFGSLMDRYDVVPTPPAPAAAGIALDSIVDLTSKFDKDGTLHWDVPPGHWTVLRMGYSLTGATNHPAIPSATGLEVDKFNAQDVQHYFHGYFDPIHQHLGNLVGATLSYMTMDSWEAGMQNWTDDMIAQFKQRRGYDPTPYLPVLAGHVVGSAQISDRFLWDFRRTEADLYASQYYGTMESELKQLGMSSYAEASGVALEIPEDTLLNKSYIDIPMGEFWVHALHPESMYYVDVRGAASAAHVYGKPIVATESYTAGGYESPYTYKKIADYWFTQGVNRLCFHDTALQPLDTRPGNTMAGTNLNRNMTWAELARPFMTYIARVSYMLQQGDPVADIAYLLPQGAPSTMPFWGDGLQPAPPQGYDYDVLNTDVLLHRTSVTSDGSIHVEGSAAMPDGVTYRLLVLPPTTLMTPEVLRKLHELVQAGATIVGPRPTRSPSLRDYPEADNEVVSLATDLWGGMDGVTLTRHAFGKGMTYWGLTLNEVLHRLNTPPDFAATQPVNAPPIWKHRRTADADIYFVANQADVPEQIDARFRVAGKDVQLWYPMDGSMTGDRPGSMTGDRPGSMAGDRSGDIAGYSSVAYLPDRTGNRQPGLQPAAYTIESGFTTVPLSLAPRESVFVVFRHPARAPFRAASDPIETPLATLTGPWTVTFPPHWGAPPSITLPALTSWTGSTTPGVKYFSGTATYTKTIHAPAAWFKSSQHRSGRRIVIDLGTVRDIAQVSVNGKSSGLVWAPPYRIDITRELHPGANKLTIAVTDEWTNRIAGDRLLPVAQRILAQSVGRAFSFQRVPPLPESGLIGHVSLIAERNP